MLSVDEARAAMIEALQAKPKTEKVRLEDAHGRVLAKDVVARRDHPPFRASAMDGYAIRTSDGPGKLKVVGESAAGGSLGRALEKGEAARIFTGAPVPENADAILIQEDAQRDGDYVTAPKLEPGHFIRPQGLDFKTGATLLRVGRRLDGVTIAAAAAVGDTHVEVYTRPRIALMSNGDEIVQPGDEPGPYQIFDSISFGLTALVGEWGGQAERFLSVDDKVDRLAAAFEKALTENDLLVTLGGASVGDHDLVKPALKKLGLELVVDTVSVRPGKPTFFGMTSKGPVLGLPGNPASALVCAHLFLRPIILAMLGQPAKVKLGTAKLSAALPANGPREHYLRAASSVGPDGAMLAQPTESQDSSLLSMFRDSDVLIRQLGNTPALEAGARVEILHLGREAPS